MFSIVSRPCGDDLVGISSSAGTRQEMTGVTAGEDLQPSGGRSQQEGKEPAEEREEAVGKESVQVYKHHSQEASSSSSDDEESENALSPCVSSKTSEVRTFLFSSSSSFPGRETAVNGVVALKDERKAQSANHVEVFCSEKCTEVREGDRHHQNRKAASLASSFSSAQVFASSSSPHLLTSTSAIRVNCSRPNSPVKDARAFEQEEGNRGTSTLSLLGGARTAQTTHSDSTPYSSSLARNTASGQERPDSSSFGVAAKTSFLPLSAPAVLSSLSSLETSQSSSSLYPVAASLPGGAGSRRLSLDSHSSLARVPCSSSSSTFSSSSPSFDSSATPDKQNSAVFLPFFSSSSSFSKEGPLTPRETASPVSSSSTTSTSFKSALSINPIGKLLQRFGETVSALKKTSPPPSSLKNQTQESVLPFPSERSRSSSAGIGRARCLGDSRLSECGDLEEEGQREREGGTFSARESEQPFSQGREHSGQKKERRQEGRRVQKRSEFFSGDDCVQKRMEETSAPKRSFSQTPPPYKIEEPGDSREEKWDSSASATGGDKKTDDESSLVPRPYQHPFLSSARLPYMPGAYESSALSRHPIMNHNTLTMAGGSGGGRGFPYSPDDFYLASSSSASSPPPPPFPVESHRAHMLMLMELQRLRGEMLHLQLATAAASKPLPPPNIIIQNKTEVASTTESNLQNLSHRDDRENKSSPFFDWVSRFFSSRLNQLIALCSVGLGCYMLLEHWRHSWRMAQLRRRVDSNILLRGVQMLEETIGVRRPTTSSPSFF
ncbi:microneme associated [Cystoisospora suis]|uniref:Microneme associated n=1 Tax=Cystoisospora suis TaxID=483139 RepID=A0A2C6LCU3_9APIC|nr:microneme associated [Cystoisospora suis]